MLHFFASNLTTSTKIISIFVFADCYITDYLKLYCIRNSFFFNYEAALDIPADSLLKLQIKTAQSDVKFFGRRNKRFAT